MWSLPETDDDSRTNESFDHNHFDDFSENIFFSLSNLISWAHVQSFYFSWIHLKVFFWYLVNWCQFSQLPGWLGNLGQWPMVTPHLVVLSPPPRLINHRRPTPPLLAQQFSCWSLCLSPLPSLSSSRTAPMLITLSLTAIIITEVILILTQTDFLQTKC